ncbi:MAG: hypothetical protein ABFS43_16465 [Thermodesulfobacteriota bacterium]
MTHHEHHHHHDHHEHDVKSELSFDEKLIKLLDHWLKHNEDHAGTYRDWAEKARQNQLDAVAALLEDVCDLTEDINAKFESAAKLVQEKV